MKYIRLMLVLICSGVIHSQVYQNTIIHMQTIQAPTKKTIILTFQKQNPIVTYAPLSYEQSNDAALENCQYLPNTQFAPNVEGNEFVIAQRSGVLVVLPVLQRKIVLDDKVIFVIPG